MSLTPEERELLAIAYLTGQATQSQKREFEARIETDPLLQATVREIEKWLAPLNELVPEAAPPDDLLDEIMIGIDAHEADKVRSPSAARRMSAPNPWKPAAFVAIAVALISTGLHALPFVTAPEEQQELVALMSDQTAPSIVIVLYDPVERRVIAQSANVELPSDLAWELWLIRDGNASPQSLGLLSRSTEDGRVELTVEEELQPSTDLLAISLEPAGGSPAEGPTGPVLFTGEVRKL